MAFSKRRLLWLVSESSLSSDTELLCSVPLRRENSLDGICALLVLLSSPRTLPRRLFLVNKFVSIPSVMKSLQSPSSLWQIPGASEGVQGVCRGEPRGGDGAVEPPARLQSPRAVSCREMPEPGQQVRAGGSSGLDPRSAQPSSL